jgi:formylglycine-generating enzyme required for sulfatase activity
MPPVDLNGHEWNEIPSGSSCLGSDNADPYAGEKEKPLREVYLPTFLISRYPTTNLQIFRFYRETEWTPHPAWGACADGQLPAELSGREDYPATYISWDVATAYCRWLSNRCETAIDLPTEAEWEKAARGNDARIWPWGDIFDKKYCCSAESEREDFCSVKEYDIGASPFGVMHMSGGVWEWCIDFHHPDSHATADIFAPVNLVPARQRVVKGGSAFCTKEIVRIACRDWTNSVNQGGADDGFRVVMRVA